MTATTDDQTLLSDLLKFVKENPFFHVDDELYLLKMQERMDAIHEINPMQRRNLLNLHKKYSGN